MSEPSNGVAPPAAGAERDATQGHRLRIGSRGSDSALWQAHHISGRLPSAADIVVIKTQGDRITRLSLDKVEGKGFFTKEIEEALLAHEVDIAVHSFKDLPIESPAGLTIAAVPERAGVRDMVIVRTDCLDSSTLWGVRAGARVGTSSLRRKAQVRARRPDLTLVDLRGNVPTRIGRAANGELDAVVLAEAGVSRLGFDETRLRADGLVAVAIDPTEFAPAPAQGALAVQIRADDDEARHAVTLLHHEPTARAVAAERALLARFGGGCQLPLGAYARQRDDEFVLSVSVAAPDGSEVVRSEQAVRLTIESSNEDVAARVNTLVERVYISLIERGASRYL